MRNSLRLILPGTILYVLVMALAFSGCGGSGGSGGAGQSDLSYDRNPTVLGLDLASAPNVPVAGHAVDAWSITPALPAGLDFDPASGTVSGLPTALAPAQAFTVTATGPQSESSVQLVLSVVRPDTFAISGSLGDDTLSVHVVDPESGFMRIASYLPAPTGEVFPRQIVAYPGGTPIYVVNQFSDNISIYDFDASLARLTPRAPVATAPAPACMLLHPDGTTAYLANLGGSTVQAFAVDPLTRDLAPVGDPLLAGDGPFLMAIDPPGKRLYVVNHRSLSVRIFAIDAGTNLLEPQGDLSIPDVPVSMQLTPDGRFMYLLSANSAALWVYSIDPAQGLPQFAWTYDLFGTPTSVLIEPTGNFLYVAVSDPDQVVAFDLDSDTGALTPIGAAVPAGVEASFLRSDNTGRFLYAVQPSSSEMSILSIDPASGALTAVQSTRTRDLPVGFTLLCTSAPSQPRPQFAYVGNADSDDVSMYRADAQTGALSELGPPLLAGLQPSALALDPWSRALYVANSGSAEVSSFVIEPGTGELSQVALPVACGANPSALCVEPSGRFLYVANQGSNDIASFALGAGDVAPVPLETVPVGLQPISVCSESTGRFLYVANQGSQSISALRIDVESGALVAVGPDVLLSGTPRSLRAHPAGRFLFATLEGSGELQVLAIDAQSGALTPGPAAAAGSLPTSVAVDPLGRFAFVTDFDPLGAGGLVSFALDSASGIPGPLQNAGAGLNPIDTTLDAGGRWLYVASQGSDEVHVLGVDPLTGALSPLGSAPAGVAPQAIAVSNVFGP